MGDGFGMGWGMLMMVAMLLLFALLIGGTIWLVVRLVGDRDRSGAVVPPPSSALEVLERRFAAGEIDADEYRERRSTLERGG